MIHSDNEDLEYAECDDDLNEIEEMDDSIDDSEEETLDESGEVVINVRKFGRIAGYKPRQAIFQIGNKCRARFVEGDPNIFFELKKNKATDNQENSEDSFKNDGYFVDLYTLLKYAVSINTKEKILSKNEVLSVQDMMEILKLSNSEAKQHAREIIKSINDNSCVKEISNEALN